MVQSVSRTVALHGLYVHGLGATLFVVGCIFPLWAVYHRTQVITAHLEIPAGPLRPAMIRLPPMQDGTSFAIAESEVTQFHFYRVQGQMPRDVAGADISSWKSCPVRLDLALPDMPLTCVSAVEAAIYANNLTAIENRDRIHQLTACYDWSGRPVNRPCSGYRLPSLDEWKYAATEGRSALVSEIGESADCLRAHLSKCDGDTTRPRNVKSLQSSPWYLHDMYGNVSEIVTNQDGTSWYGYGGSWLHSPSTAPVLQDFRENTMGMRIVRTEIKGDFLK
jgi:formylglycine-generating enzyme required for sulfatase activity